MSKRIPQLPNQSTPNLSGYTVYDDGNKTYNVLVSDLRDLILTDSITGSSGSIVYFDTDNSISFPDNMHIVNANRTLALGTSAFNNDEPERLMVDGNESFNIATFQTSQQNSFAEVNIKNFGSGSNSSTDLVLWNDISTESSSYVDLGINSSNYETDEVGYAGDGYLINAANDLYIGSLSTGDHGHIHIYGGNMWRSSSISVYNDGTIGFGTDWLNNDSTTISSSVDGFQYEFSGSVKLNNDIKVDGLVTLPNHSSHPSSPMSGSLYFNSNDGHFYGYNGSTWKQLDN